ncbi:hypothetical protein SLA_3201 [Streptomyces laurentii]|uniref:DUF6879 domain-containing protein n=1 Tax=Streptomyces laurentii TaxID=39478 RepID=A0A160P0P0_STRLU|nr:hypothetical protein SLA_3201 [Streptomyces laurentii]
MTDAALPEPVAEETRPWPPLPRNLTQSGPKLSCGHALWSSNYEWRENVRLQVAAGKRFERVRLVDEPLTEGQAFLLTSGLGNVAAGEDIRVLTRAEAEELELPEWDFWLFDSRTLVRMHIDETDTTVGVELIEDPEAVLAVCQARDAALAAATPSADVWARVRSTV